MKITRLLAGTALALTLSMGANAAVINSIAISADGAITGPTPINVGNSYTLVIRFTPASGTNGFAGNPSTPINITDGLTVVVGDTFSFTSALGDFTGSVLGGANAPQLNVAGNGNRDIDINIFGTWTSYDMDVPSGAANIQMTLSQVGGGNNAIGVGGSLATPPSIEIPEPMSLALFGLGLAGLGVAARRRKA